MCLSITAGSPFLNQKSCWAHQYLLHTNGQQMPCICAWHGFYTGDSAGICKQKYGYQRKREGSPTTVSQNCTQSKDGTSPPTVATQSVSLFGFIQQGRDLIGYCCSSINPIQLQIYFWVNVKETECGQTFAKEKNCSPNYCFVFGLKK